ncbi:MAG: FtsX-like permease family protein [bacterium]
MFIKLAWRNIFRNKRRSFIAGIAIGCGLASLIFVDALMIGMKDNMIQAATGTFLGDGQIHAQGFRDTYEVEYTIHNLQELVSNLKKESSVNHFSLRTLTFGMITSPSNVSSVNAVGIDPETEKYVSEIDESVIAGSYLNKNAENKILIGSRLAEILEVELGDRVVLTVAQAHTGGLSQELFRVGGIFHFNAGDLDRGMVFVNMPALQRMLGIDNQVHEIVLQFADSSIAQDSSHMFWEKYSAYKNEAVGWPVILPQLKSAFELTDFSVLIAAVILFGVVALGIVNTLFMSLYERMFEFGVLRSVGTRPWIIAKLIVYEAGALAVISVGIGVIIGFIATWIVAHTGINYTGIEFAGVTFRKLLYPVLTVKQFIVFPFWIIIFNIIAGIYPAVYAARMSPIEAMRKSL